MHCYQIDKLLFSQCWWRSNNIRIILKNSCKLPRTPEYAAAVQDTAADRKTVFANQLEFLAHHMAPIQPPTRGNRGKSAKKARR